MKTETGLVKKNFFEDPPPEIPGPLNPHPLEFPIPSVGGGGVDIFWNYTM